VHGAATQDVAVVVAVMPCADICYLRFPSPRYLVDGIAVYEISTDWQ
jgi:hypothetical protein